MQELEEKAAFPAELCCQVPCCWMKGLDQGRSGCFRLLNPPSFSSPASCGSRLPAGVGAASTLGLLDGRVCFLRQMSFWIMESNGMFALCLLCWQFPLTLFYWRAAESLLLFSPRSFLRKRKGKVIGVRSTQLSSCALPCAAVWLWTSGHTSLGPSKMGNQASASWVVAQIKEAQARRWHKDANN